MNRREFLRRSAAGCAGVLAGADAAAQPADAVGRIWTTRGPVAPAAFGSALCHEHVLVDFIGAEVEDHAQIGEGGQFARLRLPYRGVMHIRRIERGIGKQQHRPALADLVEPRIEETLPVVCQAPFGHDRAAA